VTLSILTRSRGAIKTFSYKGDSALTYKIYEIFHSLVKSGNVLKDDASAVAVVAFEGIGQKLASDSTVLRLPKGTAPFFCMSAPVDLL